MISSCPRRFIRGIQPTYEELKHRLKYRKSSRQYSIQPTYEELKQDYVQGKFRLALPGIQPTYEELKRDIKVVMIELDAEYPAYL